MAERRVRELTGIVTSAPWNDTINTATVRAALGDDPAADVTLILHTPGGDGMAGMAIAGQLARHRGNVRIEVDGQAASAGSAIAVAGDELVMAPGALLMVHEPRRVFFLAMVDRREAMRTVRVITAHIDAYAAHYAANTPLTAAQARAAMAAETWYTADRAAELGIATKAETGRPAPPDVPEDEGLADEWDAIAAMARGPKIESKLVRLRKLENGKWTEFDPKTGKEMPGLTKPAKGADDKPMAKEKPDKPAIKPGDTPGAPELAAGDEVELNDGTRCRVVAVADHDALTEQVQTLTARVEDLERDIAEQEVESHSATVQADVNEALRDGRITPAEREAWEADLSENYAVAGPILARLAKKPAYKRLGDPLKPRGGTGDAMSVRERERLRAQGFDDTRIDRIAAARANGIDKAANRG